MYNKINNTTEKNMTKKIEILSPAGCLDILINAVNSGADSIYFGGKNFNARRNAMNFSEEDIIEGVKYAHLNGARTYLTLNTVIFDDEYSAAVEEIKFATKAGIDAIIVQDLGMLSLIKRVSPEMEVHASTQLAAHSLSDVKALEEMGFSRVVLAREMSKDEIKYVAENTSCEIETFIHGAHCMSVSGQCFFSSALGERSGNRGLCAQVCRLPFKGAGKNEYTLSLKDMTLVDKLEEMHNIGIDTVKIEGRMKPRAYVNCVTKAVYDMRETGKYDKESLHNIFSRSGFTDGYFEGKLGKDMFGIRTEADKVQSKEAEKKYAESKIRNHIPVTFAFTAIEGESLKLTATDIDGNTVQAEGDIVQTANNKPSDKEYIHDKLAKLGGTVYELTNCDITISSSPFVSASEINSLRREVCEKLDEMRMTINERVIKPYKFTRENKKREITETKYFTRLGNISQLTKEILDLSDVVIIPLFDIYKLDFDLSPFSGKIAVELPRVYFEDEKKISDALDLAGKFRFTKAMAHTVGRVKMAKENGFEVIGGFGLNIANSLSFEGANELGADMVTLSPELTLSQMRNIVKTSPSGIFAYGKMPVMITRNCPSGTHCKGRDKKGCTITDRKGVSFEISCRDGMSEIYNSLPIYLGDKPEELIRHDFLIMHFTTEDSSDIVKVLKDYKQIKKDPPENFTRGCYRRRVE